MSHNVIDSDDIQTSKAVTIDKLIDKLQQDDGIVAKALIDKLNRTNTFKTPGDMENSSRKLVHAQKPMPQKRVKRKDKP